jgi:dipeptidyl aminopeptidase/acylaminoacyl peptidase
MPEIIKSQFIMRLLIIVIMLLGAASLFAQSETSIDERLEKLEQQVADYRHRFDKLEKMIDDVLWIKRLEDMAIIDKVFIYGPPPANVEDTEAVGANNPVRFWSYVFIPKTIDVNKKYPLIVFPHGGVHSDFNTYYTHIVRELMAQEYIVVAPEYRGSTGYGKKFFELIDYGGKEIGDADASREYMIDNYSFVDNDRVGAFGWSHGGLIAMMCLYEYPEDYKVGFAGVPVSDLLMRIEYHGESYQEYFSSDYHIGETIHENPEEYKRRSPAFNASKLKTPVLIHTNTNDDDVYAIEVMRLIDELKIADKSFEYNVYEDLPGGHGFDRIDTKLAREIRFKTYKFIEEYLDPPVKFKTVNDLERAAYPGLRLD